MVALNLSSCHFRDDFPDYAQLSLIDEDDEDDEDDKDDESKGGGEVPKEMKKGRVIKPLDEVQDRRHRY